MLFPMEHWQVTFFTRSGDEDTHETAIPRSLNADLKDYILKGMLFEAGWGPPQDGERVETKCLGEVSFNKSMELLGEELPVMGEAATKRKDNIPL